MDRDIERLATAQAHNVSGRQLADHGLFSEAISSFQAAITLAPDYLEAYSNLGKTYNEAGSFQPALAVCQEMLRLQPNSPAVLQNMAKTYGEMGRLNEALSYYYQALDLAPASASAWSDLFLTLNYTFASPEAIFLEHCKFQRFKHLEASLPSALTGPRFQLGSDASKLNIGYVSADFREHPVANLLMPV